MTTVDSPGAAAEGPTAKALSVDDVIGPDFGPSAKERAPGAGDQVPALVREVFRGNGETAQQFPLENDL